MKINFKFKIFILGLKDVIPLLIPVVPFGIIFGVIGIESGLGSTVTFLMSIIIFAGSSQLAFAQLFTGGATTPVIVSSVAIVNSRHFLYSAVIAQYLTKVKLFWKIVLSYFLTDQAFIVSQKYFKQQPKNKDRHYHLLGSGFTLWFVWQLSTVAGIILGEVIPKELNLAFAVPLTFISLIIVDIKKIDHLIVAITSGVFAIIFFNLPLRTYIIVAAAAGILVAYGLSHSKLNKKKMIWTALIFAGLVTFFTRFSMIVLLKKDYFSPRVKIVLGYVPSAVFPAIIFPAVFLNSTGQLVFLDNPKVLAALVAVLVGYLTESVIATIISGLAVLWLLIFFI